MANVHCLVVKCPDDDVKYHGWQMSIVWLSNVRTTMSNVTDGKCPVVKMSGCQMSKVVQPPRTIYRVLDPKMEKSCVSFPSFYGCPFVMFGLFFSIASRSANSSGKFTLPPQKGESTCQCLLKCGPRDLKKKPKAGWCSQFVLASEAQYRRLKLYKIRIPFTTQCIILQPQLWRGGW